MTPKDIEIIKDKYLKNIVFPKNKPKKQLFFCPVGLIGAGKTSITRPISEKLSLVILSSDGLRKILKKDGYDFSLLKKIGFEIATTLASKGFSVSFDMDCGNPEVKKFVEELSEKLNARIIWVNINTPEEYILKGFVKDADYRSWLTDNPQGMIENYFAQKEKRFKENTKFIFDYVFDASKDIKKQIEDFLRYYEAQQK
jgi:shikimate kinase